ncbi:unnamed protein product, partial [marine sediment metagenome]
TIAQAEKDGYVCTLMNRIRYIPELKSPSSRTVALGQRTAVNTPIQGSAADIIKVAMIKIQRRLNQENLKSRMILQIHDELIFESPPSEEETVEKMAREQMEGVVELKVPLKVDTKTGKNWEEI